MLVQQRIDDPQAARPDPAAMRGDALMALFDRLAQRVAESARATWQEQAP